MPGRHLDGASVHALLQEERVTFTRRGADGVDGAAAASAQHAAGGSSHLERLVTGGSACPPMLLEAFEREYGVRGDPCLGDERRRARSGRCLRRCPDSRRCRRRSRQRLQLKQGRAVAGLQMRIVDDQRRELPWDGETFGNLEVRGPWVLRRYFNAPEDSADAEGWFATGDVATIDANGYLEITDRTKDVVKSGGEWISSIQLENIAVSHPDVAEAAVVAAPHPRWDERPLLIVVPRAGADRRRGRAAGDLPGPGAEMVDPGRGGGGGRTAAHRDRQAEQARAAAAVPGFRVGVGRGGVATASNPHRSTAGSARAQRQASPSRHSVVVNRSRSAPSTTLNTISRQVVSGVRNSRTASSSPLSLPMCRVWRISHGRGAPRGAAPAASAMASCSPDWRRRTIYLTNSLTPARTAMPTAMPAAGLADAEPAPAAAKTPATSPTARQLDNAASAITGNTASLTAGRPSAWWSARRSPNARPCRPSRWWPYRRRAPCRAWRPGPRRTRSPCSGSRGRRTRG